MNDGEGSTAAADNNNHHHHDGRERSLSFVHGHEKITQERASINTVTTTMLSASNNNNNHHMMDVDVVCPSLFHVSTDHLHTEQVQIELDEQEQQLFDMLREAAEAYKHGEIDLPPGQERQSQEEKDSLEIRVAGGWVRDKLLKLQTHDVDVAVNSLTGVQIATLLQLYLEKNYGNKQEEEDLDDKINSESNNKKRKSKQPKLYGKMGIIAANPAQSKHLETATMKVCGVEVDFCNLRAGEVYEEHSRIPIVTIGTPLEDALRRDFTCNALFYNLMTKKVEDWTCRGLNDLIEKRLVTPLCPLTTFQDDPLRVLRAIRFAVRYQFALDPAIEEAAQNTDIHRALHIKVSRERVGKELEGMLSGKGAKPIQALDTIARLKLAGSVFCIPVQNSRDDNCETMTGSIIGHEYGSLPHHSDQSRHVRELGWEEGRRLLDILPAVIEAYSKCEETAKTGIDKRLLPVTAFILPFHGLICSEFRKPHLMDTVAKQFTVPHFMIKEGIKFKTKDIAAVNIYMQSIDKMVEFLGKFYDTTISKDEAILPGVCRLEAGLILREAKDLWVSCLILATAVKINQQKQQDMKMEAADSNWINISIAVYRSVLALRLDECWKVRPLLDGKAIIQALQLPRGPLVGSYLNEEVRWMLQNPDGSEEECRSYLLSYKERLEKEQQANDEQNKSHLGKSDGLKMTSPVHDSPSELCISGGDGHHFSKKMHVESMDLSKG